MPVQFDINIVGTQCIKQKKNYFSSYKVEKFSGDGRNAMDYNYHVCDQRVKTAGRVHTHMGDANRHIEMMLPKHT
jgi:hypothetical protein